MARMRYLKPEYWTDSKVVGMPMEARLLFMGSWNFAICDSGTTGAGNIHYWGTTTSKVIDTSNTPPTIAIGGLVVTED